MAHSSEVTNVLLKSPLLVECGTRVDDAGCEAAQSWAYGAKFFVPFTELQLVELEEAGFELKYYHILTLGSDKALMEEA